MDKEKLIKTLKKASELEKGGNLAMAKEFIDITSKVDSVAEKADKIAKSVDEKLSEISEELKKKLEEELNYEIDPEEVRGEKGDIGEKGEKGKDGKDGKDGKNGKDGKDGLDGLNGLDGKDGKDGSPDTRQQIVEKINSGKEKDTKIEAKQITGLPEFTREVVREVGQGFIETPLKSGTNINITKDASGSNVVSTKDNIEVDTLEYNTSYTPTGSEPTGATYWDEEKNNISIVRDGGVSNLNDYATYKDQIDNLVLVDKDLRAKNFEVTTLTGVESALIENETEFYPTGSNNNHDLIYYDNKFFGAGWNQKKIWKIDPTAKTIVTADYTCGNIYEMCYLGDYIYGLATDSLIKIDPSDLSYTTLATVSFGAGSLCNDGTYLYCGNYNDGKLYKYTTTGTLVGTLDLDTTNKKIHWCKYDSATGAIYATSAVSGTSYIWRISVSTFTISQTSSFSGIATDDNAIYDGRLWIGLEAGVNYIIIISLSDLTNQVAVATAHASYCVFSDGVGGIYSSDNLTSRITKIDASTLSVDTVYNLYDPSNASPNDFMIADGFYINTRWGYDGVYVRKALPTSSTTPSLNFSKGDGFFNNIAANNGTMSSATIGTANLGQTLIELDDPIDDAFHIYDNNTGTMYEQLNMLSGEKLLGLNQNFQSYQAIAMTCHKGATLPTSPVQGQWFLHTPTGRQVLMMHDGTVWQQICSLGNFTIYVDSVNGSNVPENGTASGASAFQTLTYALSQVPPLNNGNVLIYVSGTFTETVVIQGKAYTGPFSLTIQGDAFSSTVVSATCDSYAVGGSTSTGVTPSTLTDTGAFTSFGTDGLRGYFIGYGTTPTTFYPIISNTNDVLKIADNTYTAGVTTYKVYAPPTTTFNNNGNTVPISIQIGQTNVYINNISINNTGSIQSFYQYDYSECRWTNCWFKFGNVGAGATLNRAKGNFDRCYGIQPNNNRNGFNITTNSTAILNGTYVHAAGTGSTCLRALQQSIYTGTPSYFTGIGTNTGNTITGGSVVILFGQWFYNFGTAVNVDVSASVNFEASTNATFDTCTNTIVKGFKSWNSTAIFGDGGTTNYSQFSATGNITQAGTAMFFPLQKPTASAPTYVKGAMYFDTTLNKLRIGGATAWETVTSV